MNDDERTALVREVLLRAKYERELKLHPLTEAQEASVRRCVESTMLNLHKGIRTYLQSLNDIPEAIARQGVRHSGDILRNCREIASRAPVAAMAPTDPYRFQLPLAMYFRETGGLSDEVVALWEQATLSFQRRAQGLRLMLQSQPDGWGLIVSIGEDNAISLCQNQIVETILCEAEQLDSLKIGLVPFRQATP